MVRPSAFDRRPRGRTALARALAIVAGCLLVPMASSAARADDDDPAAPAPRAGETRLETSTPGHLMAKGLSKQCDYRTPLWSHRVVEGEYLGLIAGRYGVLRQDLIALNPALQQNPDLIRAGQELLVCPEIAPTELLEIEYEIQKGDTLTAIAEHYEMSLSELMAFQGGSQRDPNKIRVGEKLHFFVVGDEVDGFAEQDLRPPKHYARRKVSAQLAEGPGYVIKRPHLAFGTEETVGLIRTVIDRYHRRANGGPQVRVGDISKRGGGKLPPHRSHRHGEDVDIGLIHKGPLADKIRFFHASEEDFDVGRTWLLVEEFLKTGRCRYIFLDYDLQGMLYEHAKRRGVPSSRLDEYFQYPRGRRRNHGVIRHWRGHQGHIHVRFR